MKKLTKKEVADRLGWTVDTVTTYMKFHPHRIPPARRLGRKWEWLEPTVDAFIESRKIAFNPFEGGVQPPPRRKPRQ
jgi:predicted DNA-binding transcriptional regulator AlpA